MTRVVGIGGIFFKARDADRLRAWCRHDLLEPGTSPFMINYRVEDLDAVWLPCGRKDARWTIEGRAPSSAGSAG